MILRLVLRLILGGALLVAGLLKLPDPSAFAAAISTFQLLPGSLIPLTALSLPLVEIAVGGMLLAGWRLRCGAFSAMILFGLYTIALTQGLARHLPLECDCYGTSMSAPLALLRDALLLTGAVLLYRGELVRLIRCREASSGPEHPGA